MPFAPLHHTLIAMDVEKSGMRDDPLLVRMRADLRMIIRELLVRQRLDPDVITVEDLGDGYRLLLPAAVTPMDALDPFIPNLATELRLHRAASSAVNRLRLRVAVHTGLLHPEPGGTWTGTPMRELARLLDADAARRVLRETPEADLVLVVSQLLYDTVVQHGYTLDPAAFRPIRLQAKETDEKAWLHIPGTVLTSGAARSGAGRGRLPCGATPAGHPGRNVRRPQHRIVPLRRRVPVRRCSQ